jgi:uncharacterized oxidoreductase
MKLTGSTILLTGGSAGIGLALAKKLVELGNTVIITGRREPALAAAKAETPKLHTIRCDAADIADVEALAARIDADFPDLDVLINNAGIMDYRNLTTRALDLAELTRELEVNVSGPIRTISVLVDRLRANRGTILNVSSGLAYVPLQAAPIYCATKAALHSYTLSLRQQLKGQVEVVELLPPAVATEMTSDFAEGDFAMITTEALVQATIRGLRSKALEIRPGQSNQLHWMSRIAPGFIQGQLEKGSAEYVPAATS